VGGKRSSDAIDPPGISAAHCGRAPLCPAHIVGYRGLLLRNLYMTVRATVLVKIGKATAETARGLTNTCVTTPPITLDRIVPR
jgi:hypothetical protein